MNDNRLVVIHRQTDVPPISEIHDAIDVAKDIPPAVEWFGQWLRNRRGAAGLTQAQLAERAGLETAETVARYQRGEREPRLTTIVNLARALDASPGELANLLGGTVRADSPPNLVIDRGRLLLTELAHHDEQALRHAVAALEGIADAAAGRMRHR